jgi:hypothetical protein
LEYVLTTTHPSPLRAKPAVLTDDLLHGAAAVLDDPGVSHVQGDPQAVHLARERGDVAVAQIETQEICIGSGGKLVPSMLGMPTAPAPR